jgi:hypothetical protein
MPFIARTQGTTPRQLRIKVDNMVPACCERIFGGSIADTLFSTRLSLFERCGPNARQREENE